MTINVPENKVECIIMDILTELGTPDHLLGYAYVSECIKMVILDSSNINYMTKHLYPQIGKKFKTTPSKAERAIRHAIEVTWTRCDLETMFKYFGNIVSPAKGKPTNSEFIARVANIAKRRCMG